MPQWLHLLLLLLTLTIVFISLALLSVIFERVKNLEGNSSTPFNIGQEEEEEEWPKWKKKFNITYESAAEASYRYSVWKKHFLMIQAHNARKDSLYTMGLNHFSHLEHWEFVEMYLRSKETELDSYDSDSYFEGNRSMWRKNTDVESNCFSDNFDWRDNFPQRNASDQMSCGSCWAFASTSAVEWHMAIHHNKNLYLSQQQLVDCVHTNFGCNGGIIENALAYIQNHGIMLNSDYPYRSRVMQCVEKPNKAAVKIKGYESLQGMNEHFLACVVKHIGPVVIGFDASGAGLQHYKSGIYDGTDCNSEMLNHGLVLLGFGTDDKGQRYWTCQNSFSQNWGQKGFFQFKFGINLCGVATAPIMPVV